MKKYVILLAVIFLASCQSYKKVPYLQDAEVINQAQQLETFLASCQSYKKVPYLQDAEVINQAQQLETLYDAKIMPKDLLTIVVSCTLASCQSYKKVPYLQDAEVINQAQQLETLYDAKIMPKDLLTIVVSCTNPELAVPFNLATSTSMNISGGNTQLTSQPVLQQYLVDNEGRINFPVLGMLKVQLSGFGYAESRWLYEKPGRTVYRG